MDLKKWERFVKNDPITMLIIGILTFGLGMIRFFVPGLEGGGTDMREIGILVSIFLFRKWYYVAGVAFIGSFSLPFTHLEVSTLVMHLTSSLFAWICYRLAEPRFHRGYALGIFWALLVVFYYCMLLIPVLLIVFYMYGLLSVDMLLPRYREILLAYRFEIFATTAVTLLFLLWYKTTQLLSIKNKELSEALRRAEESEKLKAAFLANISHEIRTPLFGIVGFANLMSDPDLVKEQRLAYGNVIVSSGKQLLSIVSNILDLSKLETGQEEVKNSRFSVHELFETLKVFYSTQAEEKKLIFRVEDFLQDQADWLYTDRSKLQQILDNLLNNAFKFTREGEIHLSCIRDGGNILFKVKDTGSGISPDNLPKIFDRFSKFRFDEDANLPGTGIGLSICRNLASLLKGNLTVESEQGKGTVFTFTLPMH